MKHPHLIFKMMDPNPPHSQKSHFTFGGIRLFLGAVFEESAMACGLIKERRTAFGMGELGVIDIPSGHPSLLISKAIFTDFICENSLKAV